MKKNKKEEIPANFKSIEEAADFWDTHDLGDYWDQTREVEFKTDIKYRKNYVAVEQTIMKEILEIAKVRGVSSETLVNLWLEKEVLIGVNGEHE